VVLVALVLQEGEMEEVLRALDEENARLTSLSHRSNWSDSVSLVFLSRKAVTV
jgi:hypothetical protein